MTEYAVDNGISDEPAFSWWIPHVMRKKSQIIASVKARFKKRTTKYGVQVPITIKEVYELDRINNNTLWRDAIRREMENVKAAFKYLDSSESIPAGHSKMTVHMIFDVKIDLT